MAHPAPSPQGFGHDQSRGHRELGSDVGAADVVWGHLRCSLQKQGPVWVGLAADGLTVVVFPLGFKRAFSGNHHAQPQGKSPLCRTTVHALPLREG